MESFALDRLDRQVVHALQIDGRVRFARLAQVLGVSAPTVTRRYARLRREAGLRVVGRWDHGAGARWFLRITTMPSVAERVSRALARRGDTSWVQLTSGGTEIIALVDVAEGEGPAELLLRDVPRTAGITGISAHYVLHQYRGGPAAWPGRLAALDADQVAALTPPGVPSAEPVAVGPEDAGLLAELGRDGRAGVEAVAAVVRRSPSSVSRRIGELAGAGALYFDVDLDPVHLGMRARALLWMRVAPAHADGVGRALAEHAELAFVAATTGSSNLIASALCADTAALHGFLSGPLAAHPIDRIETTPVLRTVKSI